MVLQDNLSYRPFGGATGLSTGNSGAVANQYDLSARVEVINSGTTKERTYGYDNNGNLESITAPNTPWSEREYAYDALNRLTYAVGPYGVIEYTYDDVGNRLTEVESGVTRSYSYYENKNRIYQIAAAGEDTITFTYDQNGNIISMGDLTFAYDQDNRLIAVLESGTTVAEYTYNGFGQRATKVAGGGTTVFHYDFDGNIIGESGLDGTFTKEYLYRGSGRIAMIDVDSGTTYFYLNDRLGTPEMMTDYKNKLVWQAIYKPFGEVEVNPNSGVTNHFRFPGQYFDQETGLHYNYHRYYDPRTGRYLTPDPSHAVQPEGASIPHLFPYVIGVPQEVNLFAYAGNSPVNWTDHLGLIVHQGFINKILRMTNKSLKKTMRSFQKNIAEHEDALSRPCEAQARKHHEHELRVFREQLRLAEKEATKRGLLTIGTGASAFAEDISEAEAEGRTSSWFDWIDPFWSPGYAY